MVAEMPGECVIGVDLGGTKLLAGAVDGDLRVHHRAHRGSPYDRADVLASIEEAVTEARDATEEGVRAVGVGIPSLVDRNRGVSVMAVHVDLAEVAVADVLSERLGLPVFVDNDANLALLAEHRSGAAEGASHAVMLTLGTGIGGALLFGGRLYRGAVGAAGELGHTVVDLDGPPCHGNCPNRGCLEALASGTALAREGGRLGGEQPDGALGEAVAAGREITGRLVTELAHDGDPAARDAVTLVGRALGVGLANIANALNPEVIVIGGGMVALGDLLLDPAREELAARALRPSRDVDVVFARYGDESGMLGAALLALDGVAGRAAV